MIEVNDQFDDPLIVLRAQRTSRIRRSELWRRYRLVEGAS